MAGVVILTTAPDPKTAKSIARSLVAKKLAACVSFKEGFVSYYRWKGRIERSQETLLLVKTVKKNFPKIKKAIQAVHPYEVPEIISFSITEGSSEYLSWLETSGL